MCRRRYIVFHQHVNQWLHLIYSLVKFFYISLTMKFRRFNEVLSFSVACSYGEFKWFIYWHFCSSFFIRMKHASKGFVQRHKKVTYQWFKIFCHILKRYEFFFVDSVLHKLLFYELDCAFCFFNYKFGLQKPNQGKDDGWKRDLNVSNINLKHSSKILLRKRKNNKFEFNIERNSNKREVVLRKFIHLDWN